MKFLREQKQTNKNKSIELRKIQCSFPHLHWEDGQKKLPFGERDITFLKEYSMYLNFKTRGAKTYELPKR